MLRKTLVTAAVMLGFALISQSLAQDTKKDTKESLKGNPFAGQVAPFVHVVVFHLKKDAPKEAAEGLITDSHLLLAKIPAVRKLWVGRPAEKATPIAKKDYQVGLLVLFDNAAGLNEYLEHPLHIEFLNKDAKLWDEKRINVYDFVNQAK
jgi:hypothetical protein